MLTEILSRDACAKCRVCCVFDRTDYWEMPLFDPELAEKISEKYPEIGFEKRSGGNEGECAAIRPEFDEEGLCRCPMLTERGCVLGDEKPFDCRIWPFRVMKKGNLLLLTLSPVCEAVSALSVEKISGFAEKIAPVIFERAEKYPETVKAYIEGYPVFGVREIL
ncbi:MAG: hypothetical protein NC203_01665 [Firmicutes bacterium]|nr:hypothetical protein [[Eubacterium] siraeum]MCM1487049.1 hypothetical protein [Bacillota bacterium]